MSISLIAAMDKNRIIGKDNELPWFLPADLRYFSSITKSKTIIMGRNCYESIGHALPYRTNIVMSTDPNFYPKDCYVYNSFEDILNDYNLYSEEDEEIFIIGGSKIYELFLPYADKLYITEINYEFDGDCYFPSFNKDEWIKTSSKEGIVNDKNKYEHTFNIYEKKIYASK